MSTHLNDSEITVKSENKKIRHRSPELPFDWRCKKAVWRIRKSSNRSRLISVAVYTALTELASDNESSIFKTNVGLIAATAGCSARAARYALQDLVNAGVLIVTRHKPKWKESRPCSEENTYKLVSFGKPAPMHHMQPPMHTVQYPPAQKEPCSVQPSRRTPTTDSSGLCDKKSADCALPFPDGGSGSRAEGGNTNPLKPLRQHYGDTQGRIHLRSKTLPALQQARL